MTTIYKIVLLGASGSGKTSLINAYDHKEFKINHEITIGVDLITQVTKIINEHEYRLNLWDTSIEDKYDSILFSCYKDSDCILILYDITSKYSFFKALNIYEHLIDTCHPKFKREHKIILVGTKSDLIYNKKVDQEMISNYFPFIPHILISSKYCRHFNELTHLIVNILKHTNKTNTNTKKGIFTKCSICNIL